jgi:hypothetical protein
MAVVLMGCTKKPSKVEQYRAEKHERDSVALIEQERSLAYYQSQLEALMPQADSLMALFKYEKNEKYQDHGFYVVRNEKLKNHAGLRVMVQDDGQSLLVYREGKRLSDEKVSDLMVKGDPAVQRAQHLQIVMKDIRELEKRIEKTSLEVQKYQKRLQK